MSAAYRQRHIIWCMWGVMARALIIFEGQNRHPWSRLLRRGYRHVWCAVEDQRAHSWVGFNLTLTGLETAVLAPADYDLERWARQICGATEVVSTQTTSLSFNTPVLWNCVTLTKAIVGIRSSAITPWGLFRHLTREPAGEPICTGL